MSRCYECKNLSSKCSSYSKNKSFFCLLKYYQRKLIFFLFLFSPFLFYFFHCKSLNHSPEFYFTLFLCRYYCSRYYNCICDNSFVQKNVAYYLQNLTRMNIKCIPCASEHFIGDCFFNENISSGEIKNWNTNCISQKTFNHFFWKENFSDTILQEQKENNARIGFHKPIYTLC